MAAVVLQCSLQVASEYSQCKFVGYSYVKEHEQKWGFSSGVGLLYSLEV